MAQLRLDFDKFTSRGVEIIVLGPESPTAFKNFWSQHHLPFTGLPDPKGNVLKRFGQEVKIFKFGRMPAQVLIDKQGIVRFVHYGHAMSDIPENAEILNLIDRIDEITGVNIIEN